MKSFVLFILIVLGFVGLLASGLPDPGGSAEGSSVSSVTTSALAARTGRLSLAERAREFIDDSRILMLSKALLFDQKALQSRYLRVRVKEGVVLLDGFVRNPQEENLASNKLAGIQGVKRVVVGCVALPGLGIKPDYDTRVSGPTADWLISAKVRAALLKASAEKAVPKGTHTLAIDVFQGSTQVYAIVPRPEIAEKIASIARDVNGVVACHVHSCPPAQELEAAR